MSAADYIDLLAARRDWIARMEARARPLRRPALADGADRRAADRAARRRATKPSSRANGLLLRNPSVVNLLDGCALSAAVPRRGRTAGRADALAAAPCTTTRVLDAALRDRSRARRRAHPRRDSALTMHIAVIGAGIIGVTTAYELGCRRPRSDRLRAPRHRRRRIQLRQRRPGRAGLRHALGGAGHAAQGAARTCSPTHAPVRFGRPSRRCATLGWLWRWWRACQPETYRANRARMQRLAHFSRERLHAADRSACTSTTSAASGFLVLLRSHARAGAGASPAFAPWPRSGAAPPVLDAAACRAIEPGLNPQTPLHAGVYCQGRRGRQLPRVRHLLRKEAERAGARFRFNTDVAQIVAGARPSLRVLQAPHDARDSALRSRAGAAPAPAGLVVDPARGGRAHGAELRRGRGLRRPRVAPPAAPARRARCRCSRSTATRSPRRSATTTSTSTSRRARR